MDKLYFSNSDINSIVFTFAQAKANGNLGPAESIYDSLERLWDRHNDGKVDVQDSHVLFNAVETCHDGLLYWSQDEAKAREKKFHDLCLEGAEVFNQLWKLYTRQSSI